MKSLPLLLLFGLTACGANGHDGTWLVLYEQTENSCDDADPNDGTLSQLNVSITHTSAGSMAASVLGYLLIGEQSGPDFDVGHLQGTTQTSTECAEYTSTFGLDWKGTFERGDVLDGRLTFTTASVVEDCDLMGESDSCTITLKTEGYRLDGDPVDHPEI